MLGLKDITKERLMPWSVWLCDKCPYHSINVNSEEDVSMLIEWDVIREEPRLLNNIEKCWFPTVIGR
jgi:hypothetical protein